MLVGALAGRLLLLPHSTTELVNRLEKIGLVERHHAPDDRRKVHVAISAQGRAAITSLAAHQRAALRRMRPMPERLLGSQLRPGIESMGFIVCRARSEERRVGNGGVG